MKSKETFLSICREDIKRDGIEELLKWLEGTDFFTAPASTRFHGNYEGGLCEHSLNVHRELTRLNDIYQLGYSKETIAVTAPFHDLCNDNEKRLSICGTLYASGFHCAGQCLDEIAQYIDDEQFKVIHRLWKLYHLNDMHAECEHQAELGWLERAKEKVKIYTFNMTTEAISAQHKLEHTILDAAKVGKPYYTTAEEQTLLGLSYTRKLRQHCCLCR